MRKKYLKQLFVAMLAMLYSVSAGAYDFMVDGLCYNVTSEEALTVEVAPLGGRGKNYSDSVIVVPEKISYEGKEYTVTAIGEAAFRYCTLNSVTIPETVTSIGRNAFGYCSKLTNITIPESITSVAENAFYNKSVWWENLPDGVVYIGKVLYSYKGNVSGHVVVKDGVVSITKKAFGGNTDITGITIPESVTNIDTNAFSNCKNLTTIINYSDLVFTPGSEEYGSIAYYATKIIDAKNAIINGDFVFSERNGIKTLISYLGNESQLTLPANCNGEDYVIGDSAFFGKTFIENVVIPEGVTSIGHMAFWKCNNLTTITIPNSITSIGESAFSFCSGLTSITIPNSVTSIGGNAFSGCSGLTSITIPNSVTSIGEYAFYGCSGLRSVVIPENVTSIGDAAFADCSALTSITIPNSVTSIGLEMFRGCSSLTSITIGNSVTNIVTGAFDGCSELANIIVDGDNLVYDSRENCNAIIEKETNKLIKGCKNTIIPNSVTSIGNSAFEACIGLTSITIPEGVISIGNSAFSGCNGLTSITIPNSVTSIGHHAFNFCNGLISITIPNSVTSIEGYTFNGCIGLESVTIGNSVASIGDNAFRSCENLTNVTIPNSVTSIGIRAFADCSGLTSVVIPENVTGIGNYAFAECGGLESVTIGKSVESIGTRAFSGCTSLATVINYSDLVFTPGSEDYGYVAYYATKVLNKNEIPDNSDFIFVEKNGVYTLVGYTGENKVVTLPENYKGSSYVIGDSAFYGNTNIVGISVPDGVTAIGVDAFTGCTSLARVVSLTDRFYFKSQSGEHGNITNYATTILNHPGGVAEGEFLFTKIYGTEDWMLLFYLGNEKNVVLPDKYRGENYSIRAMAFASVENMESVTIPDGVKSIGASAFSSCKSLTNVTIPNSVKSIDANAFSGCNSLKSITLPKDITTISEGLFLQCKALTNVDIPEGVTSIEKDAFWYCNSLVSIDIPAGVTTIGDGAFYKCNKLKNIVIPTGVDTIMDKTFYACNALDCITLPENLKVIKNSAFENCVNLKSIEIPESVTIIGNYAFKGCSRLQNITIPESVSYIGVAAFDGCPGLIDITIPNGVTTINGNMFNGCSELKNVSLPNTVTNIDNNAFNGCTSLTSITIPAGVETIGDYAFSGCGELASIYLLSETPSVCCNLGKKSSADGGNYEYASFGSSAFDSIHYENTILYVPQGSLAKYQAAEGWKNFKNIVEYDVTAIEDVDGGALAFEITSGGIRMTAADGKPVAVYSTSGALIEKIDSYAGEDITLDRGVYIISIGGKVVKVKL